MSLKIHPKIELKCPGSIYMSTDVCLSFFAFAEGCRWVEKVKKTLYLKILF